MATPEEQQQLSLGGGARVLHTQRVLTADGEPVMVENAVYPYETYAFLQKEDLNGPLYPLLREKGLCPAGTRTCHCLLYTSPGGIKTGRAKRSPQWQDAWK